MIRLSYTKRQHLQWCSLNREKVGRYPRHIRACKSQHQARPKTKDQAQLRKDRTGASTIVQVLRFLPCKTLNSGEVCIHSVEYGVDILGCEVLDALVYMIDPPTYTAADGVPEQEAEDARDERSDLRHERRANRKLEKEKLEELVPKAMAGTKERQMEKRREAASANRAFADAKGGGDIPEINETDLMGGDEGVAEYKKKLKEQERKKSERELRRDEIARARQEEREERARDIQEKEARTMQGLMALAKARFG